MQVKIELHTSALLDEKEGVRGCEISHCDPSLPRCFRSSSSQLTWQHTALENGRCSDNSNSFRDSLADPLVRHYFHSVVLTGDIY